MEDKTWYLCNPLLNASCGKKSCHFTGAWDDGCRYTSNLEFAIEDTPIDLKEKFRREIKMNSNERQNTLSRLIFDAERRLGSYIASEGNEKTDDYAQKQIAFINQWSKELYDLLLDKPKGTKQGKGTIEDPYKHPRSVEQLQGIAAGSPIYFTEKAYYDLRDDAREMAYVRGLQLISIGGADGM
jgi:hypothetical protein